MTVRIIEGDCRETLKTLDAQSVQCCVTSPPYYGLRDYGHPEQLGLEKTPQEYVEKMVAAFREVKRVLRDDGTLWLNIGDSYATQSPIRVRGNKGFGSRKGLDIPVTAPPRTMGLKSKDLIGIPWMLAFALRADGWYLRSDIIWHKPNPMPESVTDRPTKSHEYVFLLSKSERYFYDADAIAEPALNAGKTVRTNGNDGMDGGYDGHRTRDAFRRGVTVGETRNVRSVWTITTQPFKDAHFATMPPKLVERCIKAGSAIQSCEHCGKAWERQVEVVRRQTRPGNPIKHDSTRNDGGRAARMEAHTTTTGFSPSCDCGSVNPVSSTILDPFAGAGTVGLVADRLGRNAILCELNAEYADMARKRITDDAPLFNEHTA